MKKSIIFLFINFGVLCSVFSKIVDVSTAQNAAGYFFLSLAKEKSSTLKSLSVSKDIDLAYTFYEKNGNLKSIGTTPTLYMFKNPNNDFVIISADDNVSPILGYSDEGSFSNEINPGLKELLEDYSNQIEIIRKISTNPDSEIKKEWELLNSGDVYQNEAIAPIPPLISSKWDQGCYYNEFCPQDIYGECGHVYVGCVAVAMGQIMRYWEHPIKFNKIPGYSHETYGKLSDIDADTCNWNGMVDQLFSNNSDVAALLYRCGVSADMDYSVEGSSAYLSDAGEALKDYFQYSKSIRTIRDKNMSSTEWKNVIIDELSNNRPVLYRGQSEGDEFGHAFICDGYKSDYFHFNWGWSGQFDGYYKIDQLFPKGTIDIGNGNTEYVYSGYDFSYSHYAVIKINPSPGDIHIGNVNISSSGIVESGGTIDVEVEQNYNGFWDSLSDISLNYYLSIDSLTSAYTDIFLGSDTSSLQKNKVFEIERKTLTIPEELKSGDYYIRFVTDANNEISEDNEYNNVASRKIHINNKPIANAGNNITVQTEQMVTLDGTGSFDKNDDKLIYHWAVPDYITLLDTNSVKSTFKAPYMYNDTTITIMLTVSDGELISDPSYVEITIKNNELVKVFPNPIEEGSTINLKIKTTETNLKKGYVLISVLDGREIRKMKLQPEMSITGLNKGYYLFHVYFDKENFVTRKIVIN